MHKLRRAHSPFLLKQPDDDDQNYSDLDENNEQIFTFEIQKGKKCQFWGLLFGNSPPFWKNMCE